MRPSSEISRIISFCSFLSFHDFHASVERKLITVHLNLEVYYCSLNREEKEFKKLDASPTVLLVMVSMKRKPNHFRKKSTVNNKIYRKRGY